MGELLEALRRNRDAGICPMHMPGHKRNTALFQMENPYGLDITEVEGFDNLHDAHGILRRAMDRAAALYGSAHTWFLVNGSSCGVLAAVAACTCWGDTILTARNCHKSLYNALYVNNLRAQYLTPPVLPGFEAAGGVTPQSVEEGLRAHPEAKLVVVTSPTYEGVISDISGIARAAHAHGVPLLVDEAHGAHLGLAEGFPQNAVQMGADLVVQSVHKTLPAFTQTALLHLNGDLVSPRAVERQLSLYESSSPSYLLMASIDSCVSFLTEQGREAFAAYGDRLHRFDEQAEKLRWLRLMGRCGDKSCRLGENGVFALDPSKLVISASKAGLSGPQLAEKLREAKIEPEMASREYVIAMTSLCDPEEHFRRLADALRALDHPFAAPRCADSPAAWTLPAQSMTIREAEDSEGTVLRAADALGRVCRETVFAYPPGIPLIVPGERIDGAFLDRVRRYRTAGVLLVNPRGDAAETVDAVR